MQKFLDALMPMLPETEYSPVCIAANAAAARRELLRRSFDFIIINAPLPDEFGTRFAIDASQCPGSMVLLLVRSEVYEQTNAKVLPQGVFTLAKPTPAQTLQQGLKWMAAARERLRRLEEKTDSVGKIADYNARVLETLNRSTEARLTNIQNRLADDIKYIVDANAQNLERIRRTVDWYLTHKEWWEHILSGSYMKYYKKMYGSGR